MPPKHPVMEGSEGELGWKGTLSWSPRWLGTVRVTLGILGRSDTRLRRRSQWILVAVIPARSAMKVPASVPSTEEEVGYLAVTRRVATMFSEVHSNRPQWNQCSQIATYLRIH